MAQENGGAGTDAKLRQVHLLLPLPLLVALSALVCGGCASHPPTDVEGELRFPRLPPVAGARLDLFPEAYRLAALDNVEGSRRSTSTQQRDTIRQAVQRLAPPDVRVLWSPPEVLSRYSCEFNVHHYFGFWRELLYGLLPFPHSTNESICVTADLRDNRTERRIGRYEECGFSRQFGILFLEWGDVPTIPRLRDVMVSRVLAEVVDGFRREAAQTAAPGGAKDDR